VIDLQELKAAAQKQTGRFDLFVGISPEDLLALIEVYEQRPKVEISDEDFNSIYMKWALDRDAKKLPIGDVYFNFRQGFLAALNYIRHSVDRSECQE